MELTKINLKNLIANNDGELINTKLTLDDYDWMQYTLCAEFKTKETGTLNVKFEYYGAVESNMLVTQTLNDTTKTIEYRYSTDVFEKHLMRFLSKHMAQWGQTFAFSGEDIIISFYNEVLEKGTLFIEKE